jgi:hypothetical protein
MFNWSTSAASICRNFPTIAKQPLPVKQCIFFLSCLPLCISLHARYKYQIYKCLWLILCPHYRNNTTIYTMIDSTVLTTLLKLFTAWPPVSFMDQTRCFVASSGKTCAAYQRPPKQRLIISTATWRGKSFDPLL